MCPGIGHIRESETQPGGAGHRRQRRLRQLPRVLLRHRSTGTRSSGRPTVPSAGTPRSTRQLSGADQETAGQGRGSAAGVGRGHSRPLSVRRARRRRVRTLGVSVKVRPALPASAAHRGPSGYLEQTEPSPPDDYWSSIAIANLIIRSERPLTTRTRADDQRDQSLRPTPARRSAGRGPSSACGRGGRQWRASVRPGFTSSRPAK